MSTNRRRAGWGWLLAAGSLMAVPAYAQSGAQAPGTLEVAQIPQAPVGQVDPQIERPYWSASSGFEGDTHGTGYGFFGPSYHKPLRPNVQLVGGFSVRYLYYGWDSGDGTETRVTSPGAGAKAGVRFGDSNWVQFTAGPSFKRKHRVLRDELTNATITSSRETEIGLSLGADVFANPTRRNNVHGMLHYGAEDGYTWGRIAFKQQVTNYDWKGRFTHYLGTEYIGQGNQDIRSNQVGGFVEFLHAPSSISVMLRAGYKHSSFEVGDPKTGPWYAISFWRRFR